MKVSKILCIIIILIQFIIIIAFTTNKNTSSKNVFEETKETTKKNAGTLSFMLETSYGVENTKKAHLLNGHYHLMDTFLMILYQNVKMVGNLCGMIQKM